MEIDDEPVPVKYSKSSRATNQFNNEPAPRKKPRRREKPDNEEQSQRKKSRRIDEE